MFRKYAVLTSIITLVITLYVHEYRNSTLIKLSTLFPQLYSTVMKLHTTVMKWSNRGVSSKILGKEMLFTKEELKKFSDESKGLYLAILGKVYDVGKGKKFYGPGGSYHFFTGRDGSRAFITGDFTDSGLTDDVTGLSTHELRSLYEWAQFYHREYKYQGKVVGRYYNSIGFPTPYYYEVKKLINIAKKTKQDEDKRKLLYPPCNSEWSQDSGSRVWCTNMSGGIERNWVGVPRQLYEPGSQTFRCACIEGKNLDDPNIREYPDCNPKSTSCWVHSSLK